MSLKLIQYHVHTVLVDGNRVGGVQNVTVGKSFDMSTVITKGLPTTTKNFYKKPNLTISFAKFISDGHGALLSGFNIANEIYKTPPTTYDIEIGVVGGGGFKFIDTVLTNLTYNFNNEGDFTEELTFAGHVSEQKSSIAAPAVEYGQTRRRQDFNKAVSLPSEIPSASILLSVSASIGINYGEIPTFGGFYTAKNKYISYPVDISCDYEILDIGYSQSRTDYTNDDLINDQIDYRAITIGGIPTINLGDKNILTAIDRSGGEAGQGGYSTLRYTYKNNNNSFSIS